MKSVFLLFCACVFATAARAGVQQDFFEVTVKEATGVRIVKIGPDKTATGALRQHTLLDAKDKKKVSEVAGLIELIDPKTEKLGSEEVWTGSGLTFGMAEYTIEFLKGARTLLRYGSDADFIALTPFGEHAPQGTDIMLDYPLSSISAKHLLKFVRALKSEPNQASEPTAASGRGSR